MSYKVYSLVFWNILFVFLKNGQCLPTNPIYPYNSPFRRHQRSFSPYLPENEAPRLHAPMAPINRNIYRRSMYDNEMPAYARNQYDVQNNYPTYKKEQPSHPIREKSNLVVLPRGVDEEYAMYPLKTKTVAGFDEEDQDLINEEEMGDELTFIDKKVPTRYIPEDVTTTSYSNQRAPKYVPERRKSIRHDVPTYHMEMAPPGKQQQEMYNPPTTPFPSRRPSPRVAPQENYNFAEYDNDNMYEPMMQHTQNRYEQNYQYAPNYPAPPQNNYYTPTYENRYADQPENMFTAETAAYYPRREIRSRYPAHHNYDHYMPHMDVNMEMMDVNMDDENDFTDEFDENSEIMMIPADLEEIIMDSDDEEDDVMLKVPSKETVDIDSDYLAMENRQQNTKDKKKGKNVSNTIEETTSKPENMRKEETANGETEMIDSSDGDTDQSSLDSSEYEDA